MCVCVCARACVCVCMCVCASLSWLHRNTNQQCDRLEREMEINSTRHRRIDYSPSTIQYPRQGVQVRLYTCTYTPGFVTSYICSDKAATKNNTNRCEDCGVIHPTKSHWVLFNRR